MLRLLSVMGDIDFFFSTPFFLWDFDIIIAPWKQRKCFLTEENLFFQLLEKLLAADNSMANPTHTDVHKHTHTHLR